MNNFLTNLGINLVALGCVGVSAHLVINGKDGWGWFLFAGLACAGSAVFKDKEKP